MASSRESKAQRGFQGLDASPVESDAYRSLFHARVWTEFSEAQLRSFTEPEDENNCKSLAQFIGELEDVVKRR